MANAIMRKNDGTFLWAILLFKFVLVSVVVKI